MRDWQSSVSSVFFIMSVLIFGYAAVEIIRFPFSLGTPSGTVSLSDLRSFHVAPLESLEKYQRDFSTHALFSKPKALPSVQIRGFEEMIKPYALVGIISGGEPEALIQNNLKKQTYYLQEGEVFDQFKLIEIKQHSVIIGYQNEQKELSIEEEVK